LPKTGAERSRKTPDGGAGTPNVIKIRSANTTTANTTTANTTNTKGANANTTKSARGH